jgi:hypothetical protein
MPVAACGVCGTRNYNPRLINERCHTVRDGERCKGLFDATEVGNWEACGSCSGTGWVGFAHCGTCQSSGYTRKE